MIAAVALPLLLFLQTGISITVGGGKPKSAADSARAARRAAANTDSARAVHDSTRKESAARDSVRRAARLARLHVEVTPEVLASAFGDGRARALFERAKRARLEQDSSLVAYDATARQRMSVGMGFRRIGRDRLLFRSESVNRIRWSRAGGVWVDVIGARAALPSAASIAVEDGDPDLAGLGSGLMAGMGAPIPYFPGREDLLPMVNDGVAKAKIEEDNLIHPLAAGAEAYYRYEIGDSVTMKLPTGRTVRLVELKVRARKPKWNLAIASLWFDADQARLVRAAYRLSEPMNIWRDIKEIDDDDDLDSVPRFVKPLITPMTANISAITVEYGLHEERWWLPRVQMLEGDAQVGFMHIPFSMQESFSYAAVNGKEPIPPVVYDSAAAAKRHHHDDDWGGADDSTARLARRAEQKRQCDSTGTFVRTTRRYHDTLPVAVRVPCDSAKLANSPELPKSIYDSGEEIFGTRELRELEAEALALGAQPGWAPQRPEVFYGLGYTRYNRVEGPSTAVAVEERLGAGYTARALARLGAADLQPNGELSITRSDGSRLVRLGAYRRLDAANDWGTPLSFGASLSALLFARDEGFYYRDWGAELAGGTERTRFLGSALQWRLFAERQSAATVETQFSLAHAFGGPRFLPNIDAPRATEGGAQASLTTTHGTDPRGLRVDATLRGEGAAGTFDYARALADLTATHGLGTRFVGAVTLAGGTTGGTVPAQRLFYLGGSQTVRGQTAGAAAGDAFWLARAELGRNGIPFVRPTLFGDLGWTGRRDAWQHPGRPLSGAGVGLSVLDGLVRADVARGFYPERRWRLNVYTDARF
ncbi:MAG TPA: ShlB/FhaC/HecB family hemolysin secretion/activation protein [Gemmatimonadaceae bacterium]|nr:ShlB/FhaC/HecB family hemolysin secretion/activation protein [Gemmatimonadaceae bacterium]